MFVDTPTQAATRKEVFHNPGDINFGGAETRIAPLLGSCVSIALWHPKWRIGGMCHYMLPARPHAGPAARFDGRYADGALALFLRELTKAGTPPKEYVVKIMGGARMFAHLHGEGYRDIGTVNIQDGKDLLNKHGFSICCEHLAGSGHRKVVFDVQNGEVSLRQDNRNPAQLLKS